MNEDLKLVVVLELSNDNDISEIYFSSRRDYIAYYRFSGLRPITDRLAFECIRKYKEGLKKWLNR